MRDKEEDEGREGDAPKMRWVTRVRTAASSRNKHQQAAAWRYMQGIVNPRTLGDGTLKKKKTH